MGKDYSIEDDAHHAIDGPLNPLLLIGSKVYGLKETPFLNADDKPCGKSSKAPVSCTFEVIAPTTDLRNAETFIVDDLAWDHMWRRGRVEFEPSFTSMSLLYSTPAPKDEKKPTADEKDPKSVYSISGYDFDQLTGICDDKSPKWPCVRVLVGEKELPTDSATFKLESKNLASLSLKPSDLGGVKSVRFQLASSEKLDSGRVEWDLTLPKSDEQKVAPSPAFLKAGDTLKLTVSGEQWSTMTKVTFEDHELTGAKYNKAKKVLEIPVSSKDVTRRPGHKELTVVFSDVSKNQQVPIDVFRQ
jgi:hypothetical protein